MKMIKLNGLDLSEEKNVGFERENMKKWDRWGYTLAKLK